MVKELLYTTAIDAKGVLIHINDAEKGKDYYCPLCKKEFILRNSGKKGKGSKRPHFAHNELTPNCTPETVLHYIFKKKVVELLIKFISEKKSFIINWICTDCLKSNTGNLLANVTSVKEEYNLKICQPDIALLNEDENIIAVIEIVVTHEPEEKVKLYYLENNVILLQLNVESDEDLQRIERKITNPEIVDYCHNPRCTKTNRFVIKRKIITHPNRCGRCYSQIEKFKIEINSALGIQHSLDFTDSEISTVKSKRDNIEIKTNQLTKEKYPSSICINCKRLQSGIRRPRF